jgi:hypothetical protein
LLSSEHRSGRGARAPEEHTTRRRPISRAVARSSMSTPPCPTSSTCCGLGRRSTRVHSMRRCRRDNALACDRSNDRCLAADHAEVLDPTGVLCRFRLRRSRAGEARVVEPSQIAAAREKLAGLMERRHMMGDTADYSLEVLYECAGVAGAPELKRQTLEDYLGHLCAKAFVARPTGASVNGRGLQHARSIAKRALDLVETATVPLSDDLHADLWLAYGQTFGRSEQSLLRFAFEAFGKALSSNLKRATLRIWTT